MLSSSESSEDDEPRREKTSWRRSPRKKKKKKKMMRPSDESSEDDEPRRRTGKKKKTNSVGGLRKGRRHSDDDEPRRRRRKDAAEEEAKGRGASSSSSESESLSEPTEEEKRGFITKALKREGFAFDLMPHQFEGVRFVAGLPPDWPRRIEGSLDRTLRRAEFREDRPALFADEMGLGKTVQALAACELRRAILRARGEERLGKILVVTPFSGVEDQWLSHVEADGRREASLIVNPTKSLRLQGANREEAFRELTRQRSDDPKRYVLLTRYQAQEEMRRACRAVASSSSSSSRWRRPNAFFPEASPELLRRLMAYRDQEMKPVEAYNDLPADDRTRPGFRGTTVGDAIRRAIADELGGKQRTIVYDVVLVDEAHLVKNPAAWWSVFVALCGHHARRLVAVTGTPFANKPEDVSSLIAYGDGHHEAADVDFFLRAVGSSRARVLDAGGARGDDGDDLGENDDDDERERPLLLDEQERQVRAKMRKFKEEMYCCRKKSLALAGQIPEKVEIRESLPFVKEIGDDVEDVMAANEAEQSGEFQFYASIEHRLVKALSDLVPLSEKLSRQPGNRRLRAEVFKLMTKVFGWAQYARVATIHAMLPFDGLTLAKVMARGQPPRCANRKCAICREGPPTTALKDAVVAESANGKDDDAPAFCEVEAGLGSREVDDEDPESADRALKPPDDDDEDNLDMVELARPFCELRHGAHRSCAEHFSLRVDTLGRVARVANHQRHIGMRCPLCRDLFARAKLGEAPLPAAAAARNNNNNNGTTGSSTQQQPPPEEKKKKNRIYCQRGPRGGFAASAKLERLLDIIREVCTTSKSDDKVIVYSFSKGALDLVEAVLSGPYREAEFAEIGTARYDGDVRKRDRARVLADFRSKPEVRVLLASVACAGVGLNVTAANHVVFLERWWNPTVHDQAMDRCHRIGQTKKVTVRFLDAELSIDEVMAVVNERKKQNASIIFGDGGPEFAQAGAGVKWHDSTGILKTFQHIAERRRDRMQLSRVLRPSYVWRPKETPTTTSAAGDDEKNDDGVSQNKDARDDVDLLQAAAAALAGADDHDVPPLPDLRMDDTSAALEWICPACDHREHDHLCQRCGTVNPAYAEDDENIPNRSLLDSHSSFY